MDKFPKIRYPGDSETDGIMNDHVVVTEKFDGANFRFTFNENGDVVSGSRNVVFMEDGDPLPMTDVTKDFRHAIDYLYEQLPDSRDYLAERSDFVLYGEAMQKHSLAYEDVDYGNEYGGMPHPVDDTPNVFIFDAKKDGDWLHWDDVKAAADALGLQVVPELDRGDPTEMDFEIPDESTLGGPPEGIVARRLDGMVRAKKVSDDFKETNAVVFEEPSKAQSDAAEFVAAYVTEARIMNVAHSLVEDGKWDSLKMEMMEDLPREVLSDAMCENGWRLLTNSAIDYQWDDDFQGEVRSKASKKCARVLKTELQSF